MWSRHSVAVALMGGLVVAMAAGAESVGDRLYKGIYQEETVGDLDAAMKIYQEIVADEKANRPHVALAKYRLGMCYLKTGEKKKAVGIFEGLIKEFPGQAVLLEQARGRLAALGHMPASEEPARIQLQETWAFPGLGELDVLDISRDGRYCAFRDAETGGLVVRDLTTGEDQPPIEGAAGDSASISPDGKWIAYIGRNDRNECDVLRIAGIDGSQQRVLYSNEEKSEIGDLTWSPDSQHVLTTFFDTGDEDTAVFTGGLPGGTGVHTVDAVARIATVAVADGSTTVLKVLAPEEHNNPMALFSPDGRYVSFDRVMDAASIEEDIVLIPLAGGPEIPLVKGPTDDFQLGWLPDGRSLLFESDRGGVASQVWMIQVEGGKPVAPPRLVGKRPLWPIRGPVRTPTGGWAFYCKPSVRLFGGLGSRRVSTDGLRILQVVGWEPGVETSLIAAAKQPPQPADVKLQPDDELPRNQWVDALRYVHPDRHTLSGQWSREEGGLTAQPSYAQVLLPFEFDGGYDISAEFTRTTSPNQNTQNVGIVIPVGQHACKLNLGACGLAWGTRHSLGMIEPWDLESWDIESWHIESWGIDADSNLASCPGEIVDNRRYHVLVSVRTMGDEASIVVFLDGKRLLSWYGKQSSLSWHLLWRQGEQSVPTTLWPHTKQAALMSVDSTVTFHRTSLRSVSGKAKLTPPRPQESPSE